jgi:hypothetical protein
MAGERYVGERRALRHFLEELRPLVVAALGDDSVIGYRIDRALESGDLPALRRAREIFHNQPDELKRNLMRGIFEGPATLAAAPSKGRLLEGYSLQEPEPFVRFDAYPAANAEDLGLSVALDHELSDDVPLRVMVSPGTLPSSAAQALREIANWIERDRRLLSSRHWRGAAGQAADQLALDRQGQRQDRPGGSADQA